MKTNWPDHRIDDALAAQNPMADAESVQWSDSQSAHALFDRLSFSLHEPEKTPARRPRRAYAMPRRLISVRPRRDLVIGGTAVAIVVLLTLVLPIALRTRSNVQHPMLTAARVLRHATLVADEQPQLAPVGPTGFVYTEEVDLDLTEAGGSTISGNPAPTTPIYRMLQTVTRQTWLSPDGANRITEDLVGRSWLTPSDETAWEANGAPALDSEFSLVNGSVPPNAEGAAGFIDLSKLPTDPAQLAHDLHIGTVDEIGYDANRTTPTVVPPPTIFANITQLLAETEAPPTVRAAIYDVVSNLDGVQLLGTVQDGEGRTGTAVAFTAFGERQEMIFDPTTSQLLDAEIIVTDPQLLTNDPDQNPRGVGTDLNDIPPGTIVQSETFLDRGVTTSETQVPSTTSTRSDDAASSSAISAAS